MREWISLLETFGLATAILLFFGVCIWKAAPWFASTVILPFVDRGLKLIDALIVSVVKQAETMETIGATMVKLVDTLEKSTCKAANATSTRISDNREQKGGKDMGSGG